MNWRRACAWAWAGTVATTAAASPLTGDRSPPTSADLVEAGRSGSPSRRLAEAVAAAADRGLVDQGTAAARQALADCRKGDYPGGGSGLFSLPAPGRSNAQSDHCWR